MENDPYKDTFERSLRVIEMDEANGRDPVTLAQKLVKIVESMFRLILESH